MIKITDLHEEVFNFLIQKRNSTEQEQSRLNFTLRIENKGKRLDNGFWFYGDDDNVIISFWTGNDWRYETPNIYFQITTSGDCSLIFSSGDSRGKESLFLSWFAQPLQLVLDSPDRLTKIYPRKNYLDTFDYFLENDKLLIDRLVERHTEGIFIEDPSNAVRFINTRDFEKSLGEIELLRDLKKEKPMPYALAELKIESFWPIKKLIVGPLPKNSPFVFLTGDNGTGKTSILKSIAFALAYNNHQPQYDPTNSLWQLTTKVLTPEGPAKYRINYTGVMTESSLPNIPFCCYGASRLDIDDSAYAQGNGEYDYRKHPFRSLFNHDGIFKDLNSWIVSGIKSKDAKANDRYTSIKKMLGDIIPNIYNIAEVSFDGIQEILYFELDSDGNRITTGVSLRNLSSGIRSLIVMIGDMMIRLFDQQPEVTDPSRLQGIVLIDEIDVHLHPSWQRKLPKILNEYFPDVQFIVTTHSPVPLLGAPKDSRIFVVTRTTNKGVSLERLDNQLDLGNLLPNTILTSPIFGMQDIIPESNGNLNNLHTEITFKEIKENEATRDELREIAKKMRNEEDN